MRNIFNICIDYFTSEKYSELRLRKVTLFATFWSKVHKGAKMKLLHIID